MHRALNTNTGHRITIARAVLFATASVLLSCSLAVRAVEVTGLYEAEIAVSSQQVNERKQAERDALAQVIRRVSGSPNALTQNAIQMALRTAENYVQEFSYFSVTQTTEENTPAKEEQYLRLRFDPALVNQLLRKAKQPIWGTNRPNLLTWIAVESEGQRSLVSADDSSVWQQTITQAAKDNGIPLLLPLMDLQDENSISVMDVWELFENKLEQASQRYRPEAVLGGRIYRTETNQWAGRWLLIFDGEASAFSTRATEKKSSVTEALAHVASIISSRYAIDTSRKSSTQLKLSVKGIKSLQDYAKLIAYLKGFAVISDVSVSTVEDNRVKLVLTAEADWENLQELIALDKQLQPLPDATPESEDGLMVIPYRWRP